MLDANAPHTLGVVVDELMRDAVKAWRTSHAPSEQLEVALARFVREIKTSIVLKPGGVIWLTIAVVGKHAYRSESYLFRLQRRGPRHIVVVETS